MPGLFQLGFDQAMVTMALALARIAPALTFLPLVGEKTMGHGMLRAAVLAVISLGLLPVMSGSGMNANVPLLPFFLLKEALIGLVLGLALGAPYFAATTFGELIDNQRGATMAKAIDPTADIEASLLGSFLGFFWTVSFLVGGGLLHVLQALADSYRYLPMGSMPALNVDTVLGLGSMLGQALTAGCVAAAPAVAILLLIDLMLGTLSRFASQLNPFSLALTVKSFAASIVLLLYLAPWTFSAMNKLHAAWPLSRLLPGVP